MQDSVCWVHLEFTGSFYSLYSANTWNLKFCLKPVQIWLCFTLAFSGWAATWNWHEIRVIIVLYTVMSAVRLCSLFSAWCFWGSLLLESSRLRFCCCYCCYFFLVCYAFSKRFDIFIVIILICIKKLYDLTCFRWPEMGTYLFVPFQHMKDWGKLFPLLSYFKNILFYKKWLQWVFFSFIS